MVYMTNNCYNWLSDFHSKIERNIDLKVLGRVLIIKLIKNKQSIIRKQTYFTKEILPLLKSINISPVLWGSFAYLGYSKNFEISVNDVDVLIPKDTYNSLLSVLKEKNIKYNYVDGGDCIQIFKDDLTIEFDQIEKYPIKNFQEIDFGNFKLNATSLEDLTRRYKLASEDKKVADWSMKKVKDYKIKYKKLQTIFKK